MAADVRELPARAPTSSPPNEPPRRHANLQAMLRRPEGFAFLFLVVICLALGLTEPSFSSVINFQNLGRESSVLLVMSVGVLFVLLAGGIDLSVGGMLAITAVVGAELANHTSTDIAFVIAIAGTTCVGALNGVLIGILNFSPIIVTLAMGQVLTGIALLMTANGPIQPTNANYGNLANNLWAGIPTILIAAAVCLMIGHVLLSRTRLGRYIYAVGGNETAAYLAGLPIARLKIASYTLCGFFVGAAGVLASSQIDSGDASLGSSQMLLTYAAVFLGGVGFGTATGTVIGVAIGALILGVLTDGINILGLDSSWQYIISGVLIVVAIAFQVFGGRLGTRRRVRA